MELVIADLNNMKIWNFATPETVDEVLKRAKEQHEESVATWKSHIRIEFCKKDMCDAI